MLLDFCDHKGKKKSIPYHRIYEIYPYDGNLGGGDIKTLIKYDGGGTTAYTIYLKESFQEVTDYIKMGKWEEIK